MIKTRKSRCFRWTMVGIAIVATYLLAFWPVLWLVKRGLVSPRLVAGIYSPCLEQEAHAPRYVQQAAISFANLMYLGPTYTEVRDVPVWRTYAVGDLAYRLLDDRIRVNEHEAFRELIICTVEPNSWDEVGGPGELIPVVESGSIKVLNSRQVHADIVSKLANLRAIKRSRQSRRDLDVMALIRLECQAKSKCGGCDCNTVHKDELITRAIVVRHTAKSALVDKWRSFADLDQLLAFLDHQPREILRRGVLWDGKRSAWNVVEIDRLRTYCQSKNIDLFIEWPWEGMGSFPLSNVKWEVRASDSDYAL